MKLEHRRFFRLTLRASLIGIALIALIMGSLPLNQWREAHAIRQLNQAPIGISLKSMPTKGLSNLFSSSSQTVVEADVTLGLSGQLDARFAPNSLLPLKDFENLKSLSINYVGSSLVAYPIPPVPFSRSINRLLLNNAFVDKETLDQIATNLPNLKSLTISAHQTSFYTLGTYERLLSLKSLEVVDLQSTSLDIHDLGALAKSNVREVYILHTELPSDALGAFVECKHLESLVIISDCLSSKCFDFIEPIAQLDNIKSIKLKFPMSQDDRKRADSLFKVLTDRGVKVEITREPIRRVPLAKASAGLK